MTPTLALSFAPMTRPAESAVAPAIKKLRRVDSVISWSPSPLRSSITPCRKRDKLNPMLAKFLSVLLVAAAMAQPVVVRTSTIIDGKGHVLKNKEIVIQGGRITGIADAKQKPTIDLTGLTVMPGWIDTHVHPTWYFNRDAATARLHRSRPRSSRRAICTRP